MTTNVRRAVPADAPAVTAIVREAYAGYVARIGRRPAPMDDDYARVLADSVAWVAEVDGVVAGVLVARVRPDDVHVDNVAVADAVRGRGVGGALLDEAEAYARHLGRPTVRLYTNAAMTENLAYYPRHGYRETGRGEQDGFDRVFFEKPLPPHRAGAPGA